MKTMSLLIAMFLCPALLSAQGAVKAPPADPLAEAMENIKSGDANARRQAAERLGRSRDRKAAPALMKALGDDSSRVRQAAADALGLMTWRPASPKLSEMLLKDPDAAARQQAAISLSYLADLSAGPALIKALKDENSSVRYSALHTLGVIKYAPAEKAAINLLSSEDSNMRRGAIAALGQLRSTDSAGKIAKALGDKDRYVRMEAIKALGSIEYAPAAPALTELLDRKEDPPVRVAAAQALSRMGKNDGLMTAFEFVKSPELSLRSQSLNVIAEVGDARSLQFIEELYKAETDPAKKGMLDFAMQRLAARLESAKE